MLFAVLAHKILKYISKVFSGCYLQKARPGCKSIAWCIIKQTEAALDLKGIHFTLILSTNIHLKDHSHFYC